MIMNRSMIMKKGFIAVALMTAMLAALTSCGKSSEAAEAEYIYGKINSISGNDVVLLLAEEKSEKSNDNNEDKTDASEKRSGKSKGERPEGGSRPENGEMPSGFDPKNFSGNMPEGFTRPEGGEMPSDFDPQNFSGNMPEDFTRPESGEMPSDFDPQNFNGSMPEGFTRPENGEMPSDFDPKNFSGNMPESFSKSESGKMLERSSSNYTLTGEQEEVRIPVETDVTTSQGVKTDFDALEEGSIIKCSVEKDSDGKDVVTEVWIVE